MADSIQVAQPIRLQHLHQYTSRILLITLMSILHSPPLSVTLFQLFYTLGNTMCSYGNTEVNCCCCYLREPLRKYVNAYRELIHQNLVGDFDESVLISVNQCRYRYQQRFTYANFYGKKECCCCRGLSGSLMDKCRTSLIISRMRRNGTKFQFSH